MQTEKNEVGVCDNETIGKTSSKGLSRVDYGLGWDDSYLNNPNPVPPAER